MSKVSAGEISASKSTGGLSSGVRGGSGVDFTFGFVGVLEDRFDLVETEEDETETFEAGRVESDPLEELLLPILLVRVFFVLLLAMLTSYESLTKENVSSE